MAISVPIPLNAQLVEQIGEPAARDYAQFLVRLGEEARSGVSRESAGENLSTKQRELGFEQPDAVNDTLLQILFNTERGPLSVTVGTTVLAGDPDFDVRDAQPQGSDPEDDDRPAYS